MIPFKFKVKDVGEQFFSLLKQTKRKIKLILFSVTLVCVGKYVICQKKPFLFNLFRIIKMQGFFK